MSNISSNFTKFIARNDQPFSPVKTLPSRYLTPKTFFGFLLFKYSAFQISFRMERNKVSISMATL
jgi:hypothetical protein